MNTHIYDTDMKKVLFALSYLQTSPAESWVEDFTEDTATMTSAGHAKGYGTFPAFKTLFLNDFGPANSAGKAMTKLTALKQSSFGSLTEYIAEFRLLAGRAGVTHVDVFRHLFLTGLNPGLTRSILGDDLPTSNDALVKKAISKQANFEQLKGYLPNYKGGGKTSNFQKSHQQKKRFTSTHNPNAMEVDRMTGSSTRGSSAGPSNPTRGRQPSIRSHLSTTPSHQLPGSFTESPDVSLDDLTTTPPPVSPPQSPRPPMPALPTNLPLPTVNPVPQVLPPVPASTMATPGQMPMRNERSTDALNSR
jgi:hypothetical protein